jgi:O-acetyl-ADP-ribose deacetylase (regulator of RNase III)
MDLPRHKDYSVGLWVAGGAGIRLARGDITRYPADAMVNAANPELLPGGGVCGAIHDAGGPAIAGQCRRIHLERGPIATGQAVATTAGELPAKYVIHAVGPVWRGGHQGEAAALASCYREALRIADELKLHSIAYPAISTGIFGYPIEQAARVAVPALVDALSRARHIVLVSLVLFDRETLAAFVQAVLSQRKPVSGKLYPAEIDVVNN